VRERESVCVCVSKRGGGTTRGAEGWEWSVGVRERERVRVFPLDAFFVPGRGHNIRIYIEFWRPELLQREFRGFRMVSGRERRGTWAGAEGASELRGGLVELVTRVTALARILHTHSHHRRRHGFSPPSSAVERGGRDLSRPRKTIRPIIAHHPYDVGDDDPITTLTSSTKSSTHSTSVIIIRTLRFFFTAIVIKYICAYCIRAICLRQNDFYSSWRVAIDFIILHLYTIQ
jgi:hypothetical protein